MTHKEKDLLVGQLVDKSVALKKRVDFLEAQDYEGKLKEIEDMFASYRNMTDDVSEQLIESEKMIALFLYDIRDLYKRLDEKNEDIQILNTLIDNN